ncbi:HEAT repeat domain-containing protein [Edaphobacter paludis]|uniref:HEAT repeat domain-containing protein n=1 Tax=Edaphobacter paludis TaxID=3035702 RepID=A0AAU7CWH7_9BACT
MPTHARVLCLSKTTALLMALLLLPLHQACAQNSSTTDKQQVDGKIVTTTQAEQPTQSDRTHKTAAENNEEAWSMLTTAVQDPKHADLRIQALAALGTLGENARGEKLISAAMRDSDVDVRTAAVLSAGQTKSRNLTIGIRALLDDKEPQVAFVAATTLWKMNDRSGEDILVAVVNGDRSANPGMVNGTMHKVNKEIHDPGALARMGALQGASMLLGPFGFGLTAIEYMRKNGGDNARVSAIEQLSQEKTAPIRAELIAALTDKDPAVRAAAATALGSYRERSIPNALLPVFDDAKAPVRLTAAAAYIRATHFAPSRKRRAAR